MKTISHTSPDHFSFKRQDNLQNINSLFTETELLRELESVEFGSSFDEMTVRIYPAGSMVFMPEDPSCERLYILKQGRVNLYRLTANGKCLVTRQIQPGSVFGVRGLLGRTMQKNFAEAVEDSTIGTISREQVLALLKRRPDLTLRILETVCNRLYLLEERLVETVYNPVSLRLAYFLLTNVDSVSGILTNVTHEEIGNTIGAVRQTVTETLGVMRRQGLILTGPKRIRIINRHGLEQIIQGSETQPSNTS